MDPIERKYLKYKLKYLLLLQKLNDAQQISDSDPGYLTEIESDEKSEYNNHKNHK